jgi:hypothetical protein
MQKRSRERPARQTHRRIISKRDYRGSLNNPAKAGFLSSFVLRGQEGFRSQETSSGLSSLESTSTLSTFQNGKHPNCTRRGSSPRISVSLGFPIRICALTNLDTLETSPQSQHPLKKSNYLVQSSSFRSLVSTSPFHQDIEGTCTLFQVQRPSYGGFSR